MSWQTGDETLYEIVMEAQGKRWLVAYANKTPSRRRMITVLRNRWAAIENTLGREIPTWDFEGKAPGALVAGECRVFYSGRTKLDAQTHELPFIGE